jgi:6-pyruvoyl-tetrahydropterin synthase
MHGEKEEHFVMDLKQVKNKLAKADKKVDANAIFDYSHSEGKKVKMGKKPKKDDPNKMQMSFYNLRSTTYKRDNK